MKVLSLFWHSVEPDSINPEYLDGSNPTQSVFREQIEFIVDKFTPISIYDFMNISEHNRLLKSYAKPPVLLGFDDGFKNVINCALPILQEFRVPALFFVIGEILINSDFVPWYVEMKHLIRSTKKKNVVFKDISVDINSKQGRGELAHYFYRSYRDCKVEEDRQRLLISFAGSLNVDRPTNASMLDDDLQFVSKQELSDLDSASLLTVVSHAMTHQFLASLTFEEQTYELEQSNLLLSKYCPSYYPVISYPGGSFNKDTLNIAKHIYKFGFATFPGSSYNNFYAYPRTGIKYDTVKELNYILSPLRLNLLLPIKQVLHKIGLRE